MKVYQSINNIHEYVCTSLLCIKNENENQTRDIISTTLGKSPMVSNRLTEPVMN